MKKQFKLWICYGGILLLLIGCAQERNSSIINEDVEFDREDYQKVVLHNNQLGFDLLASEELKQDGNLFISPISLFMALSMVQNGADGNTLDEMNAVLHSNGMDSLELSKANASWMDILHRDSDHIQLHVANSIWLNNRFSFQEEFAQLNRDYFNAHIEEFDISTDDTVNEMNDWIKRSTNQKIDEVITSPLDSDTVAILLNAIYFKGDWKYEFNKKRTEVSSFYLDDETSKEIPLMMLEEELAYLATDDFQAVSLPYGNEEMSMKVFLPKEEKGLKGFLEMLTYDNWKKWTGDFKKKEGTVYLPSFELEYELVLNNILKELGMESAFDYNADFTRMIEEKDPIWISEVKQKTFLEVNEEGTEAAASTSVGVVTESATLDGPFYMRVDRPFFLAIVDDETETILFMGAIRNP
ncbi:serpin family protein [Ornithinibacillus sp. BX22]|uniref:Serpin family protein n=2 Tax=Ornithinibacillus TaxID=484508 RepID=A0A923L3C8_9BACI|nr:MULTISPECIES: serpin family protein [Ornithinibacillus]MBC5635712.1 serpin family protein [Ornithinibacillus hominis]MBS3679323.1 serpin family protein [Ornithinibacillus massiliensis]